jgi:hypothetical protein
VRTVFRRLTLTAFCLLSYNQLSRRMPVSHEMPEM